MPNQINKRVLVWRGAGVLGSKLCARLLTDVHRIYYLHKLATGGAPNIAYFACHPHFNFIYDVLKPITARVVDLTSSRSHLVYRPLSHVDSAWCRPDIRLAQTHLEWESRAALNERLAKTIAYFKRLLIRFAPEIEIKLTRTTVALSVS